MHDTLKANELFAVTVLSSFAHPVTCV